MEIVSRLSSIILIIFLSPLLAIILILCLLFQGNPIFFKQERIGYKFKPFYIYKFRSMVNNKSDSNITSLNDSRITAFGHFLRFFKLDEFPQLYNILRGDMRFIGPRPEVDNYIHGNDFTFLDSIKPGITDFSSILLRNEPKILEKSGGVEKYNDLLKLKLKLAHLYSKHKSFSLDLVLVCVTIISIFLPRVGSNFVIYIIKKKYNSNLESDLRTWIDT